MELLCLNVLVLTRTYDFRRARVIMLSTSADLTLVQNVYQLSKKQCLRRCTTAAETKGESLECLSYIIYLAGYPPVLIVITARSIDYIT